MTTPLAEKIKAIIRVSGPISVTDYFALCLADPDYGYYRTRDPFGRSGDFVTDAKLAWRQAYDSQLRASVRPLQQAAE